MPLRLDNFQVKQETYSDRTLLRKLLTVPQAQQFFLKNLCRF